MQIAFSFTAKDLKDNPKLIEDLNRIALQMANDAGEIDSAHRKEPDMPEDTDEEKDEEKAPSRTIEEVRAILAKVGKAHGAAKAKEILNAFGASKVTDLKEEFYDAVIIKAEAVI